MTREEIEIILGKQTEIDKLEKELESLQINEHQQGETQYQTHLEISPKK